MKKSVCIGVLFLCGSIMFAQNGRNVKNGNWIRYNEYDQNGNIVYTEKPSGFKEWREFNALGKLCHYKNSGGDDVWYTFDARGNTVSYTTQLGELFSCSFTYDQNDNLILQEFSHGGKTVFEYNTDNLLIHKKGSEGYEYWYAYDARGNKVSERLRAGDGGETEKTFSYDETGNLISETTKSGTNERRVRYEYNEFGKRSRQYVNGFLKSEYEYNTENYLALQKNYDADGSIETLYYEYTYYPDGKIQSMKIYETK